MRPASIDLPKSAIHFVNWNDVGQYLRYDKRSRQDWSVGAMAKETEPFELSAMVKQAMQAYGGVDSYFDFLKKTISSLPSGGTEFGERWKSYAEKNIDATHEFIKQLSQAKDFEQMMRIQMEFMQSQANAFGEQMKSFGETYTKAAAGGAKMPFKSSLD